MINITVKYFASLREKLAMEEQTIMIEPGISVASLWQQLHPELLLAENIKVAVNFQYVDRDYILEQDTEIAFFPPVTGG